MYKAKVINVESLGPLPNSDNLNLLTYNGMEFIVGKDLKIGDMVVLFPADGQLSHEYCRNNNLYSDSSLNKDTTQKGYFGDNRKVKSIRLRGNTSEGFVAKMETLNYLGRFSLRVGDEFDSINGQEVCRKFVSQATQRRLKEFNRNTEPKFKKYHFNLPEHYDTEQMDYNYDKLPDVCDVIITAKVHGTSARTGYNLVDVDITNKLVDFMMRKLYPVTQLVNRVFKKSIFHRSYKSEYQHVSGTRHTIINNREDITNEGGQEYFRWQWHNIIAPNLKKDEVFYYEICGYDSMGVPIMSPQDTTSLKDKTFQNKFGKKMVYSYGCSEGGTKVFIYRITQNGVDLPFSEVMKRCDELGFYHVPVLVHSCGVENPGPFIKQKLSELLDNGPSMIDQTHIEEGYVVRIEYEGRHKTYKAKNSYFKILEGYMKELDVVDMEEAS